MINENTAEISSNLWNENVSASTYGTKEQYYEHTFEQYKIFIDMADKVSTRRTAANTFFLTLHTLLITTASFGYGQGIIIARQWLIVFPLLAVIVLCWVWWRMLHSYRQLNTAKYKVIGEYEKVLPSSPYWRAEWTLLGNGQDRKLYWPLTDIENYVPVAFSILWLLVAIIISI